MIVCVCHRVSDREIKRQVRQGCTSFEALQFETGVSTCCGCCESCARDVFQEAQTSSQGLERPVIMLASTGSMALA